MSKKKRFKRNRERSKAIKEDIGRDAFFLCAWFDYLEQLTQNKRANLPDSFVAMQVIMETVVFNSEPEPDWDMRYIWPEEWGDDYVMLPKSLLLPLAAAWSEYANGDSKLTLGEALGIERLGRGKNNTRDTFRTMRRDLSLVSQTHALRMEKSDAGTPIDLADAFYEVGLSNDLREESVKKAWQKYSAQFLDFLVRAELIEER